jgi:hypothetical protein
MILNFEYIAEILGDYCDLQTDGVVPAANRYPVSNVMEQVALLEGAQHLVDLAKDHRDACIVWEKTMMQAVGEDGPGDVVKAINAIKAERDALAALLVAVKESGGTGQSPCAKFCESVALGKDFYQLREHADKMQVERDNAWQKLRSAQHEVEALQSKNAELTDLLLECSDELSESTAAVLSGMSQWNNLSAENAELTARVEQLKELASFWIDQAEPRNASKQEYNTWLALGYESSAMRLTAAQLARIKQQGGEA